MPSKRRKPASAGTIPNAEDRTALTRLSVNLNAETAAALKEIAERRGASLTETVRRAVAVLKFVEDEIEKGSTVQSTDGGRSTRDLHIV